MYKRQQMLQSLPLIWKTVLFCGCVIAVECLCLYQLFWDGNVVPIILLNVLVCLALLSEMCIRDRCATRPS